MWLLLVLPAREDGRWGSLTTSAADACCLSASEVTSVVAAAGMKGVGMGDDGATTSVPSAADAGAASGKLPDDVTGAPDADTQGASRSPTATSSAPFVPTPAVVHLAPMKNHGFIKMPSPYRRTTDVLSSAGCDLCWWCAKYHQWRSQTNSQCGRKGGM